MFDDLPRRERGRRENEKRQFQAKLMAMFLEHKRGQYLMIYQRELEREREREGGGVERVGERESEKKDIYKQILW